MGLRAAMAADRAEQASEVMGMPAASAGVATGAGVPPPSSHWRYPNSPKSSCTLVKPWAAAILKIVLASVVTDGGFVVWTVGSADTWERAAAGIGLAVLSVRFLQ